MTRFITVQVGCDWNGCDVIAPEGEGIVIEKAVSIDGKQGRAFLLCKEHVDDFEAVVLPLMQAGVKVESPAAGGRKKAAGTSSTSGSSPAPSPVVDDGGSHPSLVCQVPGCDRHGRPLRNRTGMAQHVIKSHQYVDLATYEAEFGPVASVPRKSKNTQNEAVDQPVDATT
jgi:hypothetical protein